MSAVFENDPIFRFRKTRVYDRIIDRLRFSACYRNNGLRGKPDAAHLNLIAQLRRDGYLILDRYLAPESLSSMQRDLAGALHSLRFETPCLAQSRIDAVRDADLIRNYLYATPEQLRARGLAFERTDCKHYDQVVSDFNPSTLTVYPLAESDRFRAAWLDPFVLSIVAGYLGMVPKLAEAYVRRNFPSPFKTMNHFWHRDLSHKHYLVKVFYFLSDCTLDNGPHEFIRGSHGRFDRFNGKRYYADDEIDAKCPAGSVDRVISEVRAGTVIIEDTRGVHRARMPDKGFRDLGYAVFMPMRESFSESYFSFPRAEFDALTPFQRAFIPACNLV